MTSGYQALSTAIQKESAQELEHAEDEYAVAAEATLLKRKNDARKRFYLSPLFPFPPHPP